MAGRERGARWCALPMSLAAGILCASSGCDRGAEPSAVPLESTSLAESSVIFPIGSRKEIPLTVPCAGELIVTMQVQRGETLAVRLIEQGDYANYLSGRDYRSRPEFDATYVRDYQKTGPVAAGNFYLVIFDPTAADVSKHPFNDVHFKVVVRHARR